MPKLFLLTVICFITVSLSAQDRWDLKRSVDFALANNISVKQADVQARISALQVQLSEAGRYPNVALSTNAGYNFGRTVNPATNSFENQRIFFSGFSLQSNV